MHVWERNRHILANWRRIPCDKASSGLIFPCAQLKVSRLVAGLPKRRRRSHKGPLPWGILCQWIIFRHHDDEQRERNYDFLSNNSLLVSLWPAKYPLTQKKKSLKIHFCVLSFQFILQHLWLPFWINLPPPQIRGVLREVSTQMIDNSNLCRDHVEIFCLLSVQLNWPVPVRGAEKDKPLLHECSCNNKTYRPIIWSCKAPITYNCAIWPRWKGTTDKNLLLFVWA